MEGFAKMSKYSGMREDLVQAGGGNSSFKISDTKMAIKASGFQLADVTETDGYALVNPRIIREKILGCEDISTFTDEDSKKLLQDAFIEGKRPSIETFLHAISGKYTLHTHSMVVNVLTSRKGGMEILKELFPEALLVPYATPGAELTKAYFEAYKKAVCGADKVFDIVFLKNHGLVVSADTADEVINKTEEVTRKIENYLGVDLECYHKLTKLWNSFPDKVVWKVTDANILNTYEKIGAWENAFCPDCVVFLGKGFLMLGADFDRADINSYMESHAEPVMVDYEGDLYIIADSVKKAMETQSVMSFSAQVMLLNNGHECDLLSDREQSFLLNWDAEKYRRLMK